jgi:FixJ family two-component response regulator
MKAEALVCVVDHDESTRKVVARLLQSEKYSIESFASAHSFLNRKAHVGPCCLVLEAHMPDISGLNVQKHLSKRQRTEQVVFMSERGDIPLCAQAFKAGAIDFLTKPLKEGELQQAVREALLRSGQLRRLRQEKQTAQALLNQLTPREREVLSLVVAGKLNKVIAAELGTTEKTIKKHRGHLMQKLRVSCVAELVLFSIRSGLKPQTLMGLKSPIQVLSKLIP